MRALVTGATGFVGSHLVPLLVERGDEVAILRRPGGDSWRIRPWLASLAEIAGDVANPRGAEGAILEFEPEAVFHLAWSGVEKARRDDPAAHAVNIEASLALLGLAARAGCRTWVGLGSQAEYGPHEGPIDEQDATSPRSAYGAAKLEACAQSRRLADAAGVRFLWLRLFSAYGPADHPSSLVSHVITTLLRGGRPALTTGNQRWDFLYTADAAEAIAAAADAPGAEGIFNLGSGQTRTIRAIVEMIRDLIDPALPLGFGEVPVSPGATRHLEANIGRLAGATGWRPRTTLEEGLTRTVAWHRDAEAGGRRPACSRHLARPVAMEAER
jgi:nucleoside-diphosphate-sugar epimerase